MITITTNAKPLELSGEEIHVRFEAGFTYCWVRNDGDNTVMISLYPNISEGKDGVVEIPAGSSAGIERDYRSTALDLYLLGSGKVQIMGTGSAHNPFKSKSKGGGDGGGVISKVFEAMLSDICETIALDEIYEN